VKSNQLECFRSGWSRCVAEDGSTAKAIDHETVEAAQEAPSKTRSNPVVGCGDQWTISNSRRDTRGAIRLSNSKGALKWSRQGSAAMIVCLMWFFLPDRASASTSDISLRQSLHGHFSIAWVGNNAVPKFSSLVGLKCVSIDDYAPKEYWRSGFEGDQFAITKLGALGSETNASRPQDRLRNVVILVHVQDEPSLLIGVNCTRSHDDIMSGSLAEVLNSRSNRECIARKRETACFNQNISAQLSFGGASADHGLPEAKSGQERSNENKQNRNIAKAASVFGYQAIVYVFLGLGIICQILGLHIWERDRAFLGILMAGFGLWLCVHSGLAALSFNVAKQIQW
jgi:hypothetical protein